MTTASVVIGTLIGLTIVYTVMSVVTRSIFHIVQDLHKNKESKNVTKEQG